MDRLRNSASDKAVMGLPFPRIFQGRIDRERRIDVSPRLVGLCQGYLESTAMRERLGNVRIEGKYLIQRELRRIEMAEAHTHFSLAYQGRYVVRLQRKRTIEARVGFSTSVEQQQRHAAVIVGIRIVWLEHDSAVMGLD